MTGIKDLLLNAAIECSDPNAVLNVGRLLVDPNGTNGDQNAHPQPNQTTRSLIPYGLGACTENYRAQFEPK